MNRRKLRVHKRIVPATNLYGHMARFSMRRVAAAAFLGVLLPFVVGVARAQVKSEIGELNGFRFRIDVPERRGPGLVLYFNPGVVRFPDEPKLPVGRSRAFLDQGYAIAQSEDSSDQLHEAEALLRYFTL